MLSCILDFLFVWVLYFWDLPKRQRSNKRELSNIVSFILPFVSLAYFQILNFLIQIWHSKPGSNILATAPSNSAADLLAHRLSGHIPKTEILRYYAPTRPEKEVPEYLRGISNLKQDCSNPSTVMKFRLVSQKYSYLKLQTTRNTQLLSIIIYSSCWLNFNYF